MNKSFLIAVVITVIAAAWILSGFASKEDMHKMAETGSIPEQPEAEKIPEVRIRSLIAQEMNDYVEVTGRTQASRQVVIRSETEGRISSLNFKKGATVKKGQVLARLEVKDRSARLEEAKQLLEQRKIQYQASKELSEKGFNSRVRLAQKEAELKSAAAQVTQAQSELSNIVMTAPFTSIVNGQMIEIGDYVSRGGEILELVDLNPIEVVGYLTENQVAGLSEGEMASAVLLNGQVVEGKVTFIAAAADQDTRTFEMELTVSNDDYQIKEGLTAKILVPFHEERAYKISPSVLSLSSEGAIGVKVVNSNDQAEFMPVRLLKDTPDYLWVGGLPDKIRLITVGQEFVVDGQTVNPIENDKKEGEQNLL